jgi:hypothetical protein
MCSKREHIGTDRAASVSIRSSCQSVVVFPSNPLQDSHISARGVMAASFSMVQPITRKKVRLGLDEKRMWFGLGWVHDTNFDDVVGRLVGR